jgi:hypothetical protein
MTKSIKNKSCMPAIALSTLFAFSAPIVANTHNLQLIDTQSAQQNQTYDDVTSTQSNTADTDENLDTENSQKADTHLTDYETCFTCT